METKNKFSIVSRAYMDNFKKVVFVVLNSETGELRIERINNELAVEEKDGSDGDLCECSDEYECDRCSHDREVRAKTARNIRAEIMGLLHGYPVSGAQHAWNNGVDTAAECCNGYEQEQ